MIGNVASKSDLKEMEAHLDTRFAALDVRFAALEARMAEQSRDHYKHFWIMGFGIVGLTVTLIKLL